VHAELWPQQRLGGGQAAGVRDRKHEQNRVDQEDQLTAWAQQPGPPLGSRRRDRTRWGTALRDGQVKWASAKGAFSTLAWTIGNRSPKRSWNWRAVVSCAAELSSPTGRVPRRASQADTNTKTAPVFRSRADSELAGPDRRVQGRGGQYWGISFGRLFDMSNGSGLLRTAAQLAEMGCLRDGAAWEAEVTRPRQTTMALTGGRGAMLLESSGRQPARLCALAAALRGEDDPPVRPPLGDLRRRRHRERGVGLRRRRAFRPRSRLADGLERRLSLA
jgi:hypothetical protein